MGAEEVCEVAVLAGRRMPELAEPRSKTTLHSYVIKGWEDR